MTRSNALSSASGLSSTPTVRAISTNRACCSAGVGFGLFSLLEALGIQARFLRFDSGVLKGYSICEVVEQHLIFPGACVGGHLKVREFADQLGALGFEIV
jgi:hypothetical protein